MYNTIFWYIFFEAIKKYTKHEITCILITNAYFLLWLIVVLPKKINLQYYKIGFLRFLFFTHTY